MDGMSCEWCGNTVGPFETDHGLPKSVVRHFQGGYEDPANKWILCLRDHHYKTIHVDAELVMDALLWERCAQDHYRKIHPSHGFIPYREVLLERFVVPSIAGWIERAEQYMMPRERIGQFISILNPDIAMKVARFIQQLGWCEATAKEYQSTGRLADMLSPDCLFKKRRGRGGRRPGAGRPSKLAKMATEMVQ